MVVVFPHPEWVASECRAVCDSPRPQQASSLRSVVGLTPGIPGVRRALGSVCSGSCFLLGLQGCAPNGLIPEGFLPNLALRQI